MTYFKQLAIGITWLLGLLCAPSATAQPATCSTAPSKIAIAYVNGVNVSPVAYRDSVARLVEEYGMEYKDKTGAVHEVRYPSFYNETDGINDLLEVFRQIGNQNPELKDKTELLYSNLVETLLPKYLPGIDKKAYLAEVFAQLVARKVASDPEPTTTKLTQKMLGLINEGRKIVLISHSQGNLFSNSIVMGVSSRLVELGANDSFKILNLAPPAPLFPKDSIFSRSYFTNKWDSVIDYARAKGFKSPAGNVELSLKRNVELGLPVPTILPGMTALLAGHFFDDIYMLRGFEPYTEIKKIFDRYMEAMATQDKPCMFTGTVVIQRPTKCYLGEKFYLDSAGNFVGPYYGNVCTPETSTDALWEYRVICSHATCIDRLPDCGVGYPSCISGVTNPNRYYVMIAGMEDFVTHYYDFNGSDVTNSSNSVRFDYLDEAWWKKNVGSFQSMVTNYTAVNNGIASSRRSGLYDTWLTSVYGTTKPGGAGARAGYCGGCFTGMPFRVNGIPVWMVYDLKLDTYTVLRGQDLGFVAN